VHGLHLNVRQEEYVFTTRITEGGLAITPTVRVSEDNNDADYQPLPKYMREDEAITVHKGRLEEVGQSSG
jgi:hypothetical protein